MIAASWHASVRYLVALRKVPPRVAVFLWRARRHAARSGDEFSLASAIRPAEMGALLALARGCHKVVELGTGTGWSAIALALDNRRRRVTSYDAVVRPERNAYLAMVPPRVRERIELRDEPDTAGPRQHDSADLLFVDSSHDRDAVLAAFRAWRAALAPDAVVAFHDYDHPNYPGVREAVAELALAGDRQGGMFVWRVPR